MKDFTRGLLVGLLAGVGFTCIVATAADAPPEPKDLASAMRRMWRICA